MQALMNDCVPPCLSLHFAANSGRIPCPSDTLPRVSGAPERFWRCSTKCAMVVMTTPDMQAALLPGFGICLLADRSGFQNTSATLLRTFLEYLLSEVCHTTLALLQSFWFLIISNGDAATPGKLKGTNTLYRPSTENVELGCKMEAASVKDNMKSCFEFLKGITNEHYHVKGLSDLLPVRHYRAFQDVDCKSADEKLSGGSYLWSTCRPEDSQLCGCLAMSFRTRPFSNNMEEENDLTERCKARSYEAIEGPHTVDIVPRKETSSWILAAKNKDDDEDEEDEDEEDEDEDEYVEDEDDDGEGGDEEEEDEDGGAGGDDGDADKNQEDDDAEDDEEGYSEEDEDDEDVDEESSSDEDETPPKKMRK